MTSAVIRGQFPFLHRALLTRRPRVVTTLSAGIVQPLGTSPRGLERNIGSVPSIAFNAVLQASWAAVAVSFQAGLLNGGPTSLVWGTLLSWVGTLAPAASLAEMASINPMVGAQYRWTALHAPRSFLPLAFWSLLQGWISVFAWIALCTQVAFLEGTIIQGLIIFGNSTTYTPERWHGTLIAWAVLLWALLFSIYARKILAPLELIAGAANILFFFIFVIVLVTLAPRSSASFVLTTTVTGQSGWSSPGVQWCIGLLSAAYPLTDFDGIIHMSAEVKEPHRRVPQSMVLAVLINGLFAFCFMIVLLFTTGDLGAVLDTRTGYPIIEVLFNAMKSEAGTIIMMSMICYLGIMAFCSGMTSVSRLTWAFARDRGLPFGNNFFAQVKNCIFKYLPIRLLRPIDPPNPPHPPKRPPARRIHHSYPLPDQHRQHHRLLCHIS